MPSVARSRPLDLQALYERYHRMVVWLVRSHVPEAAVDDVVQDVFVALHRRLPQAPTDAGESLGRWVLGVVRSVCHSHRRSDARRRARLHLLDATPAASGGEAEAWLDDRAALDRVARCLQHIEPRQREAFALIELHGLTVPEAAEVLGTKLNTVYSRLRLARRKLARAIDEPRATVASARRAGRPSKRQSQRTWGLVAVRVGLGSGPSAAPVAAATGYGWVGALAGASLAGLMALGIAGSRGERPAPEPVASRAEPRSVVAASHAGASEASPEASPSAVAVAAPARPSSVAPSQAREERPARREPAPRPRRATRARPDPDLESGASTIGAEARLLRDAARHLDAGELEQARQRLDEHAERYADGVLLDERSLLEQRFETIRRHTVTERPARGAR